MRFVMIALLAACASRGDSRPTDVPPLPPLASQRDAPGELPSGDPAEPTPPEVECKLERRVQCQPGQPTRTAELPSPFEQCPATIKASDEGTLFATGEAKFSAAETRNMRHTNKDACCYVAFLAKACR